MDGWMDRQTDRHMDKGAFTGCCSTYINTEQYVLENHTVFRCS